MGGIFGVASKSNCVSDLFFGTDYHSHLGTRRGGMAVYGKEGGFNRAIHNIQNAPFRTKFERDVQELEGRSPDTVFFTDFIEGFNSWLRAILACLWNF